MDVAAFLALLTPAGAEVLEIARSTADKDPLIAASAMRRHGFDPDLAAAALTQTFLRAKAAAKFGPDADRMFFTRTGLEQATRSEVADRRAARLADAGVTRLTDLGCGIGADAIAAARAGISVHAVEADPLTAAVARANASALGLDIRVTDGRAEDVDLAGVDAAFCDPARRRAGGRVFDPDAYSPSWTFVTQLVEAVPRTVLKLAPGIDHALIPAGAEAEWVSAGGDVLEAAFWCGPLAEVPRRATLIGRSALTGSGAHEAPVGAVRRYVHDPDGAVVRAHLIAELGRLIDGTLGDPTIAYLYTDEPVPSPFTRCYAIDDVMPFSLKRLRTELRARDIGRLTVKKRGSALEPEQLRKDLRLRGREELTIILTRVAGEPTVLLTQPIPLPRPRA